MLLRQAIPECLVWLLDIVPVFEVPEDGQVEVVFVALPDLPSHRAVEACGPSIEFGRARWQHPEGDPALLTASFDARHKLRPAVDLHCLDRDRHPGDELGEATRRPP